MSAETQRGEPSGAEVLTLPEVAAYLRVPEQGVLDLFENGMLPGQRIGGEWRVLKRVLVEWLRSGSQAPRDMWRFPPPWMVDHPFWEDFFHQLERRILSKIPAVQEPAAKPGSKQAVLRHFGVFKDDGDLEAQLAAIRARREAAGE
jgi:excisionase family DNA binding protein